MSVRVDVQIKLDVAAILKWVVIAASLFLI